MQLQLLRSWIACEIARHLARISRMMWRLMCNPSGGRDCGFRFLSQQPTIADRIASDLRITPTGWPAILMVVVLTAAEAACACHLVSLGDRNLKVPRSINFVYLWPVTSSPLVWVPHTHIRSQGCGIGNLRFPPLSRGRAGMVAMQPTQGTCSRIGAFSTWWPLTHKSDELPNVVICQWEFAQWTVQNQWEWSCLTHMRDLREISNLSRMLAYALFW